jgi:hypothetical protein
MQPSLPSPTRPLRGPRRRRFGCLTLLVVLVGVLILIYILPTPWALHIGDRFTPLETWSGNGKITASNGGTYMLSATLEGGIIGPDSVPDCDMKSGCDTLHGSAKLCTESGKTYSFALTGAVHSWLSTNGATTNVGLTGGSPTPLPDGWVVAFHGKWHGPALVLASPDNSFTEVFTSRGAIRTTTSTADAGTATVTLRYGSTADFARACRALAAG